MSPRPLSRIKLQLADPRERGITAHGLLVLGRFVAAFAEMHDKIERDEVVFDEHARECLEAAMAAQMFLSSEISDVIEPYVSAFEVIRTCPIPPLHYMDHIPTGATNLLAQSMVAAVSGSVRGRASEPAPTPPSTPKPTVETPF